MNKQNLTFHDYYNLIRNYDNTLTQEELNFAAREAENRGLSLTYSSDSSDWYNLTGTELKIGDETLSQVIERMPSYKVDLNSIISSLNGMINCYDDLQSDEEVRKSSEDALRLSITGAGIILKSKNSNDNKVTETDEDDEFHETMSSRRHH